MTVFCVSSSLWSAGSAGDIPVCTSVTLRYCVRLEGECQRLRVCVKHVASSNQAIPLPHPAHTRANFRNIPTTPAPIAQQVKLHSASDVCQKQTTLPTHLKKALLPRVAKTPAESLLACSSLCLPLSFFPAASKNTNTTAKQLRLSTAQHTSQTRTHTPRTTSLMSDKLQQLQQSEGIVHS